MINSPNNPTGWTIDARGAAQRSSTHCGGSASGSSPTTSTSGSTSTATRACAPSFLDVAEPRCARRQHEQLLEGVADDRLAARLDRRARRADAGHRQADRIQHVVLAGVRPARGRRRRSRDGEATVGGARASDCAARATSWSAQLRAIAGRRRRVAGAARCTRSSASTGVRDSMRVLHAGSCARRSSASHPAARSGRKAKASSAGASRRASARLDDGVARLARASSQRRMSVAKPSLAACRVDIAARTLARWVAVVLIVATTGAIAADARKTLHVAFPVAETGFDPQAIGDTYSDAVCLGIFDPLYRYDYFARPVVLEPNTADGAAGDHRRRPHVHDQGQARHLLRRRSGVRRQAPRAHGGRLRVQHQARVRPEGPLVLAVPVRADAGRARRPARARAQVRHVRLRREDRGPAGGRPLHAAHPLQAAGLRLQVVADDDRASRRSRAKWSTSTRTTRIA